MKFSIRDLMWFTVVVALVMGLAFECYRHLVTRQTLESLRMAAVTKGCGVEFEYDSIGPFTVYAIARLRLPNSQEPAPITPKK